jgi:hypothetical protein
MKKLFGLLLGVSLAANIWLLVRHASQSTAPAANLSAQDGASSRAITKAAPALSVGAIKSTDPTALCDALRAAGADDRLVRAVLEGVLRRREREKLAAQRIDRTRTAWWRTGRTAEAGDAKLAKEMVADPLQRLLGRDPADLADAENRYAFLPPEKRRLLAQIDLDYQELLAHVPQTVLNTQLESEAKEQQLLAEERRKDLLAALSPEERAEYDLRFSGTAGTTSRRAGAMVATEAEFRALKPVIDDFDQKSRALPKGDGFTQAYADLQRTTTQQLVATLGYDRAMDYVWSGSDSEYSALRRATEAAQLPATTPARVMDLAVETGRQAATIHDDASLNTDQKRAALLALQESAKAQLATVLPSAAQQQLPADGLRWLNALGEGRYFIPSPAIISSGGYTVYSVTNPPPKTRVESPVILPRSPGK